MKKMFFIIFVMCACFARSVFSQSVFTFDIGFNALYENYIDDGYVRNLLGIEQQANFFHTLDSFIGFFVQDAIGYYFDSSSITTSQFLGNNLSLAAGPSFIIRHDNKLAFILISLGPTFQWHNERYDIEESVDNKNTHNYYEYNAFDIGIIGDYSVIVQPKSKLTIRLGCSTELFFVRFEDGQSIRNIHGDKSNNYLGIILKPHVGIGYSF